MYFVHKFTDIHTKWSSFESKDDAYAYCSKFTGTFTIKEGPCLELAWVREAQEENKKWAHNSLKIDF